MLGGVLGWFATTRLGLDFFTGLVLVAASMAAFGWLVDRLLIERVRGQGEEPGILLTIGLSILIVNLTLLVVGPAPMNVAGAIAEGPLFLGPVLTTKLRVLAVPVGAALILCAQIGRAMCRERE